MSLRATTIRRLTILCLAVLLMIGAGAALYWRNEHRKATRMAEARSAGMTAFAAEDYRAALDALKYYVARNKTDIEALYAYGVSRARLEEPNGKHISEGITVFSTLLQFDPGHLDAKHRLLELYPKALRNQEAVELAERVLLERPEDELALKAKTLAHDRLREYDKALAASQKLNEINPQDLDQQLVTYEIMRKLKSPPEAMLDRARRQQQARPDDPRFQLLLAMAYGNAGDVEQGKRWLSNAATRPAPDAAFVRHMVRVLDSLKMYSQSQQLLDRVIAQNPDPLVMRVLVQRLWQNGQNEQVIKLLADLDPASDKSDTGLLAYRALALFETGQKDEARAIIEALSHRNSDSEAVAWSTALDARFKPTEPRAQLEKYQEALVREPENPIIRYLVGEAYARLGETDLAIAAWRRAAEIAPSWATPHVDIARSLAAGGRIKEALLAAEAGVRANPSQISAAVTLANIRHRAIEEAGGDPADEARLLNLVTEIQRMAPGEPETLPLYANLLAKAGRRDDAIAAVRTALSNPKRYDPSVMLRMAAVNRNRNLGLEKELSAASESADGADSPRIALARAADIAATGSKQDGLAYIQDKARAATSQPVQWQLAVTQYKEIIRDPSARAEWVALGDSNPKDLGVQSAILKTADSVRADREFIARTIERVKELTGPEGQTWKLERARWLLGGDGGKDTAEAVNILTEIVRTTPTLTESRLLLAAAFEQINNIPGATKELQAAFEFEPNSAAVAIEVARLMQQQNQFVEARAYLERAAQTPELSSPSRRRIASMLADQAEYGRAIKILKQGGEDEKLDTASKLLLADIHRREGRAADAEAIYKELLAASPVDLETLRGAANFYAVQGDLERAKGLLQRADETAGSHPGQVELARATFAERHVDADTARPLYIAATRAAPRDAVTWRHLAAHYLRDGRYEDARVAAETGLQAAGREDAVLRRLVASAQALAAMSQQNAAPKAALAALGIAAAEDRGVSEFLTGSPAPGAGAAAATSQPSGEALLARLRSVASRHPRSIALQSALVQWHLARREFSDAGQVAQRLMEAYPREPDPARVAASVWRAAGQFDVAVSAIQKWRERSGAENALQADLMIAEIRLAQGDAPSAARALQPHLDALKKDPQKNQAALASLLRAYVLAGREREARQVLEPLLAGDRAARALWLQLAANDVKDPVVAAEWIRQVAPAIAKADVNEQVALGSAWYNLSVRPREGRFEVAADEAVRVLDPIVNRGVGEDEAPVDAILLRAAVADRAQDRELAEALYRRGLKLRPDQPEALNNLAYLILLRGGDLNEARTMIARALALSPDTASFHDTLARVQQKMGERDAAIASFRKALDLEPSNVEAMIGLASALTEAGKRDAAAALLPQIDTLLRARPNLPAPVRRELDVLRATVKASL